MATAAVHPFGKLPFELVREVCLDLDKRSIKNLRLAYPAAAVPAAAGAVLFETVALRLSARRWSLAAFEQAQLPRDYRLRTLCHTRTLVVDTRYIYIDSDALAAPEDPGYAVLHASRLERTAVARDDTQVSAAEYNAFFRVLSRTLAGAESVRRVKWRTSHICPPDLRWRISCLLCRPAGYTLSFSLETYKLTDFGDYFSYLSYLHHLDIRCGAPHDYHLNLATSDITAIAGAVRRSPSLRGFGLYFDTDYVDYYSGFPERKRHDRLRPLLAALEVRGDTLEYLKGSIGWGLVRGLDWSKMKALRNLDALWSCVCFRGLEEPEAAPTLYNGLTAAGVQLRRFTTNAYRLATHQYLLRHAPNGGASTLTEICLEHGHHGPDSLLISKRFWTEVIPLYANTLRRLSVAHGNRTSWCWRGPEDNYAKDALLKCRRLEELAIGFCDKRVCYLGDMIETLVRACPRLRLLDMIFSQSVLDLLRTMDVLTVWSSMDGVYANRSLYLCYQHRACSFYKFPVKHAVGTGPPVSFDYLVQSWRLQLSEDGDYRFERRDDEYFFNDLTEVTDCCKLPLYARDFRAAAKGVTVPYDPNWRHYVDLDAPELTRLLADMTALHAVQRTDCPVGGTDEAWLEEGDEVPVLDAQLDRSLNSLTFAVLSAIEKLEASIAVVSDSGDLARAVEEFTKYGIADPHRAHIRVLKDVLANLQRYLDEITYLQRQAVDASVWASFIADTNSPFPTPAQNLPVLLCDMTDCTFNNAYRSLPSGEVVPVTTVTFYTEAQTEFAERIRDLAQLLADSEEINLRHLSWSRKLTEGAFDFSSLVPGWWEEARRTPRTVESVVLAVGEWIRCWYIRGRVGSMLETVLGMSPISQYLNGDPEAELVARPDDGWPWQQR
ncbi:hypothetical protein Dda_8361 [Drechslerella dactyloides]|uniref:F-box domain-containing protein n=1 Tax=Drechslerella dactyloides TaxID=74499 RepID=A0AAD6IQC0_DREDA|nr:hypothetical protein Dda_8361 [Drechslerella dactyloides]